ncbi:hypothetical protein JNW90_16755 [Micromonospora sp. STR1s_5]|nr:hypothetical protein [Micromonospora sp. STR1s_5]
MIGPAEIADMMDDYAAALEGGDPIARATTPVWAADVEPELRRDDEKDGWAVGMIFGPPFGPGLA